MWFDTTAVFLTKGASTGGQSLNAFDNALRAARIVDFNLIKVSSIVPSGIPISHLSGKHKVIKGNGLLMPTIYEFVSSNELGAKIAVGVGVGLTIPNTKDAGVIFTYSCIGSKRDVERVIAGMVSEGMRAKGYTNHRCEMVAISAIVKRPWTCILAAACFCDDEIVKRFPALKRRT
jgi:pyruvoyl-dependent arginine decarboxylase